MLKDNFGENVYIVKTQSGGFHVHSIYASMSFFSFLRNLIFSS